MEDKLTKSTDSTKAQVQLQSKEGKEGSFLSVRNLHVEVEDKVILNDLSLDIGLGEIHVIMGPNGAGKSTLANALMGDPKYEVTGGDIYFDGQNVNDMKVDERARAGMFLSFQHPQEISGISLENFLRTAKKLVTGKHQSIVGFRHELADRMKSLDMAEEYGQRNLNEGFSGGEKKKSEILQMLTLEPKLAILDETDSGLDVDAVRIVALGVKEYMDENKSAIIITHHKSILEYLEPDFVHVMIDGQIIRSGKMELMEAIQEHGFDFFRED